MTGRNGRPTLHLELSAILRERRNRWMTTGELADEVNKRGRYAKRDGSPMAANQVSARVSKYSDLFERREGAVKLVR